MSDEPKEDEPVETDLMEPRDPMEPPDEPPHVAAKDCWCSPVEDEPGVWVHRERRLNA